MDIYNYLKKDHRKVSDLMEQVVAARSADRRLQIVQKIKQELLLHAETEQETFYAALENEEETEEEIEMAEEEHEEVKMMLNRLTSMSPESDRWLILFGQLKQAVEHHVKEEEEMIFPKAQEILSDDEAEELAEEMDMLKQEYPQAA